MTNETPTAPAPLSWEPGRPFRYVGGDAALDFVNTVDWTRAGLLHDRLTGYDRLLEWAEGAGVLRPEGVAAFREAASARPRDAEAAIAEARALRQELHRLASAVARPAPASTPHHRAELTAAAAGFSGFLGSALARLALEQEDGGALRLVWPWERRHGGAARAAGHVPLLGVLWPVARAAAELLTSGDASRIRTCGGIDCGWLFVDRSRNGLRRWCEMETCGTLAKERRRASKRGS